jgi:hypothetical protein
MSPHELGAALVALIAVSDTVRAHCRRAVKRQLRALRPNKRPEDGITRMWLAAKCGTCRACPKMVRRFQTLEPEVSEAASAVSLRRPIPPASQGPR